MRSLYYDPNGERIFVQEEDQHSPFTSDDITQSMAVSTNYMRIEKDKIKTLEDEIVQLRELLQRKHERTVSYIQCRDRQLPFPYHVCMMPKVN